MDMVKESNAGRIGPMIAVLMHSDEQLTLAGSHMSLSWAA